ncbi:MAG: glycosyltransferase, partial [Actinobacteria bacterium]|nr:glycosyltransferase [Actinomycetota bacterium]
MYDIVIGIPSRNEADSIKFVTETIDKGLIKYFSKYKAIIVNADNNSKDNTKEVFLSSKTKSDKKYIRTTLSGKGRNVLAIIKYASKVNAKSIALFDADVKTTSQEWIKLLLEPVLIYNVDLVTPLYRRNRMEGNTTNHLMYPYLYAIYNQKIQQPIGGEFALSRKLYKKVLNNKKWESTYLYGIDIMLTALALKNKMLIKQQFLGRKMHKPSFPKQRLISSTELDTLFHIFLESINIAL